MVASRNGATGNGAEDAAAAARALRKEVMMAQNLHLLGYDAVEKNGREARVLGVLSPHMLDRPNERLLLSILHFLLTKLSITGEEFRFCWPIATPHDKSNFKRQVQLMLQDLEKSGDLPIGSSQASRINTGCGPRVIDLIWRLSTHVMKMEIRKDQPTSDYDVPSRGAASSSDQIVAMKARIAVETEKFKQDCIERGRIQEEWLKYAKELTRHIQEVHAMQRQVQEERVLLDSQVDRVIYTQAREGQRTTQLKNMKEAWASIDSLAQDPLFTREQAVLDSARRFHDEQPTLDGSRLKHHQNLGRDGQVDLHEVVRNAEAFLRASRHRLELARPKAGEANADQAVADARLRESNNLVASLCSLVQRMQQLLTNVRDANDLDTRAYYIKMAASVLMEDADETQSLATALASQLTLCPLTPAQPPGQADQSEKQLMESLKKAPLSELSDLAASSVRKATRKKKQQWLQGESEAEVTTGTLTDNAQPLFRRLDYDDEAEDSEAMEL
ncbi:TPA: hypothetical protein N0F65_012156 [Lagenidium giganteum]|uniref:HAUS augmin-like complex subunit 6 N-terminal domain-containing protein n=1 Tax=Lagenidium giganteum TaxID=4803 RepID=A0AAV2YVL4_9STRA|nr:TPA: hypothetical protein N0F65_012156 [Lagenidium giganteum]